MQVQDFLRLSTQRLEVSGVKTVRLDCLILLEDVTGKDRSWLLAHPEYMCQGRILTYLNEMVERRIRHEPLTYIRGRSEFYGREFLVDKHVLVPRPESEAMIELLTEEVRSQKLEVRRNLTIVDVGTGSGCLAITAKLELPEATVIATDIDGSCLKVAQKNAKNLGAAIKLIQGDLLKPIFSLLIYPERSRRTSTFYLLCNLPYVPDNFPINQAATHEPKLALFAGQDGLDLYRQLFNQIATTPQKPQYILTESLPFQHAALSQLAKNANYKLLKTTGLIQVFGRVSALERHR